MNNKNKTEKYFDLCENLIKSNSLIILENNQKGDSINKYIREEIEKRKDLPFYGVLIEELDRACSELISPIKWENCSKGIAIEEQYVLLSTSKCRCGHGGEISIVESNCKIKSN